MATALLSDAHIVGDGDPAERLVVRFLDTVDVDEVVVLGDLFHHWWGFRGERDGDPRCEASCEALRRLVGRGVQLSYVPGNHDFMLGPFFLETLGARVDDWHWRELEGNRVVLAHGDECDRRLGYRATRRGLRSAFFRHVVEGLGAERGRQVLARLAGASRDRGGGDASLLGLQRAWARRRLEEGATLVVMGHSHRVCDERVGPGRYINLGDFARDRTWCLVDGHGARLMVAGEDGSAVGSRLWGGG